MFSKFASPKVIRRNLKIGRWIAMNPNDVEADIEKGRILVKVAKANKTRPAGRIMLVEVPLENPAPFERSF